MLTITPCTGAALSAIIPALARLRVQVFRAFPYLYDGDEAYEAEYLQIYQRSARSAVIVARDGDQIVGASTCLPLVDETQNVQAPFRTLGLNPADYFYFGESVLLPEYRGQGAGVAFFDQRLAHARASSECTHACFCAVVRPGDHSARPAKYVPLDDFWHKRGFAKHPGLVCEMRWKDIGEPDETSKSLQFWVKSLR